MRLDVVTYPLAGRDARRVWHERRALLVVLDDGATGEAAPLPGYSPDTLESCHAALAALEEPRVELLPDGVPAARFALETALLAREGGLCAFLGIRGRPFPVCQLVARVNDAAAADVYKVKIGVPGDHALCAALRARFPKAPLRLDANGALGGQALVEFARYQPELVEEPAELETRYPFPVALDESLQTMTVADVAGLAGRVHALVLKPMTLGGALRCLELARAAERLGLAVCASHLHDGPVARAATRALAAALPGKVLACGV